MKFFKRLTAEPSLESWQKSLGRPLVKPRFEDGVVYDEYGEVLYADESAGTAFDLATNHDTAPERTPEPLNWTKPFSEDTDSEDTEVSEDTEKDPARQESLEDHSSEDDAPKADQFLLNGRNEDMDDTVTSEASPPAPRLTIPKAPPSDTLSVELPGSIPAIDVTIPRTPRDTSDLLHKRANLSEVRMDVARITSDIQGGERLYQRAQQRVESLMNFVERAEVDFSLLNRLEPENKRLKARNRVLEAESEADKHTQRRLQSDLEEVTNQLEDARIRLQASEAKLGAMTTQIEEKDRELARLSEDMEQVGLRLERTQTTVDVESRENIVLRDQITELSTRMDDVTSERMELAKMVESLKIDCDDFRAQKDQAVGEVSDLRAALATAQKVNGEMKTRMVGLHEEIKSFKTQYEISVISRDDRILKMESRLADLSKQVRIKDDVARSALADVAELRRVRTAQDVERERLERLVESQQRQLDEANTQIQRSSASMMELDQRYNDVAAALSIHQERLKSTGDAAPLSPPPPVAKREAIGDVETLTPETVEDLITDYKLGLRETLN